MTGFRPPRRYAVFGERGDVIALFGSERECRSWVTEGMLSCEGAERDHYVDMMRQLAEGKRSLVY